ncbi:MAG: DUF2723 domain-containing protein [Chloroflexia bacterium]
MTKSSSLRATHMLVGAVVALAAFGLYVLTLAPSVMPGDYAEFQLCAAVLGVPHPTGYPLYVLLGKLFTLLPFGDVAYRVNFSSAAYMAGTVWLLYFIALRLARFVRLDRGWWSAGIGAGLFAVAPTVWSMSLVARSYALNALLVASVISFLLLWRHSGRIRWFYFTYLFIGLSMVHHGTTYLLLPAYGLYLLLVEVERRRSKTDVQPIRRWIFGVASLLLGLSPMLFLVYRFVGGSSYYWGNPSSWKDFFSLLTGGPFHNQVMGFGWGPLSQIERIDFGIGELSGQYTAAGIAVGLLGLAILWRSSRGEAMLFTLMMLGNFLFAMNYSLVGYLYFIPTFLIWGICMAIGLAWTAHYLLARLAGRGVVRYAVAGVGVMLAGAILFAGVVRYPNIDQSGQTQVRDEALALLRAAPQGASLYLDWEDLSVIRFYRMVYGMRPDVTLYSGDPADWAKLVWCDWSNDTVAYVGKFAGAIPPIIERDFRLEPAPMGRRVLNALNSKLYEVPPCGMCATCR